MSRPLGTYANPVSRRARRLGPTGRVISAVLAVAFCTAGPVAQGDDEVGLDQIKETIMDSPASQPTGGKQLDIEGRPMWITHMGCLIACSKYLGNEASDACIYGGCGHAFAINIHDQLCPSGPTAWPARKCDALAANVGLKVTSFDAERRADDFDKAKERIWKQTCQAIDAGRPCFGWEMSLPEWFVVRGYDAEGNYMFLPWDDIGRKPHDKLGESEIGWACVRSVQPCEPADDRTVVREAVKFALAHGAGEHSSDMYHTGLSGYDTWIAALADPNGLGGEDEGFGLAYNAQCWAECRKYAAAFLAEAKTRLADEQLAPLLDEALTHYVTVAAELKTVAETYPFDFRDRDAMAQRAVDADRRATALEALRAARAAEEEGLKALAKIAKALEPNDSE